MRILHFVHNFPPEFRGGTELYVMNLSQRQARAGNKIRVVAGSAKEHEGDDQKFELAGRVRVTRIFKRPEEYAHPIDPYTARLSNDFRKLILDFHPDIVHVHHWHMLTIDLVRMARDLGIPVVLTLHDFYPVCSRFFRIRPGNSDVCPPSQSPGECYNCIRNEKIRSGQSKRKSSLNSVLTFLGYLSPGRIPHHDGKSLVSTGSLLSSLSRFVVKYGIRPADLKLSLSTDTTDNASLML